MLFVALQPPPLKVIQHFTGGAGLYQSRLFRSLPVHRCCWTRDLLPLPLCGMSGDLLLRSDRPDGHVTGTRIPGERRQGRALVGAPARDCAAQPLRRVPAPSSQLARPAGRRQRAGTPPSAAVGRAMRNTAAQKGQEAKSLAACRGARRRCARRRRAFGQLVRFAQCCFSLRSATRPFYHLQQDDDRLHRGRSHRIRESITGNLDGVTFCEVRFITPKPLHALQLIGTPQPSPSLHETHTHASTLFETLLIA